MYGKGEQHVRCVGPGSWGQLRPMLHLTRGCPLILSPPIHLFLFFLPLFKPRPAACRASFAMGMPFPSPSPIHPSPPFLTRSKEVSGVTVSTACRLSVPPIPSPQNTKSSAFPEPTATVPHSLLFIWEGRHPLIFGISGHYEISLTPKPWSKLFRKHLSSPIW